MKKKILIPYFLLMGTSTACNDGLVTKGVPFKHALLQCYIIGIYASSSNSTTSASTTATAKNSNSYKFK